LEQKLLKFKNKNYINQGTKIIRIREQKLRKSRNKNYINLGTKITKILEEKYRNKNIGTVAQNMAAKETRLARRIKLNLNMEQNCRMWGTKNIGTVEQNMNAKQTI
jgi:hypothetical protein